MGVPRPPFASAPAQRRPRPETAWAPRAGRCRKVTCRKVPSPGRRLPGCGRTGRARGWGARSWGGSHCGPPTLCAYPNRNGGPRAPTLPGLGGGARLRVGTGLPAPLRTPWLGWLPRCPALALHPAAGGRARAGPPLSPRGCWRAPSPVLVSPRPGGPATLSSRGQQTSVATPPACRPRATEGAQRCSLGTGRLGVRRRRARAAIGHTQGLAPGPGAHEPRPPGTWVPWLSGGQGCG